MDDIQIRRQILQLLYDTHKCTAQKVIEEDELTKKLRLSSNQASSNLLYLSEKGLVQVQTISARGSRVYRFVRITSSGIDLVDDRNEFNERFPPVFIGELIMGNNNQVSHRSGGVDVNVSGGSVNISGDIIGRDKIQASVGDNASNVNAGKDIHTGGTGLPTSAVLYAPPGVNSSDDLTEAIGSFLASLESTRLEGQPTREAVIVQLNNLQEALNSGEIDLGIIQRIKRFLTQQKDVPVEATRDLFSHPAVKEPIQRAVADLTDSI